MRESRRVDEHHLQLLRPHRKVGRRKFCEHSVAGIVDHEVETARTPVGRTKPRFGLRTVPQIQNNRREPLPVLGDQRVETGAVARRAPDADPLGEQHFRKGPAEARARTRNERRAVQIGNACGGHSVRPPA